MKATLKKYSLLLCLTLLTPLMACAEGAPMRYMEGVNYEEISKPQRTADPKRIEVKEVFWYGCSHCFSFEPIIHAWNKEQKADVNFVTMPAMWNQPMQIHARLFYTAEELGVLDKVHLPVFNAMHLEKKKLLQADEIFAIFEKAGVKREAFEKAWKSFSVSGDVKRAAKLAQAYRIKGTPEVIVNGKYRVSSSMNGGQKGMMEVVDFLVAKERAALAKK